MKKPKGFKAFDDLARKLVKVSKSELSTPKPKKNARNEWTMPTALGSQFSGSVSEVYSYQKKSGHLNEEGGEPHSRKSGRVRKSF